MKALRPALVLIALLAAPAVSWAAEVIGRATAANGAPIAGAEVSLGSFRVRADGAGRFVFRNVVPGVYQLSCGGRPVQVTVRDGINQFDCRA